MVEAVSQRTHHPHSPHPSWALVLVGILAVAAGIIVLAQPAISLVTLAVITGIFLLVGGLVETISEILDTSYERGFTGVVLALASVIVGVLLIRHPLHGVVAMALLFGLWLIIAGMVRFATALNVEGHGGWNLVVALVELIAGIVIVSTPDIGIRTLALFIGISWILRGLALCAIGWLVPRLLRGFGGHGHPTGTVAAT